MLGRRSYARVMIADGAEGVLRLARDIGLHERHDGDWTAISREAGVLGETVLIDLVDDGVTVVARVVESKPIVTDGAVRHRLWLRKLDADDPARLAAIKQES
ncbi:MAG TPA: hypothetical protein VH436_20730 [Vicinamibacterales bacterium]